MYVLLFVSIWFNDDEFNMKLACNESNNLNPLKLIFDANIFIDALTWYVYGQLWSEKTGCLTLLIS